MRENHQKHRPNGAAAEGGRPIGAPPKAAPVFLIILYSVCACARLCGTRINLSRDSDILQDDDDTFFVTCCAVFVIFFVQLFWVTFENVVFHGLMNFSLFDELFGNLEERKE